MEQYEAEGCIEHSLGLQLAAGGLARVGEEVVALAEGVHLHYEVPWNLVPLHMGQQISISPGLFARPAGAVMLYTSHTYWQQFTHITNNYVHVSHISPIGSIHSCMTRHLRWRTCVLRHAMSCNYGSISCEELRLIQ